MIRSLLLALFLSACSSAPVFVATDERVPFDAAERACRDVGGELAGVGDIDAVLDSCRDSGDSGPCWLDLTSADAAYAITLDGHLMAVPLGFGEALAICEVR